MKTSLADIHVIAADNPVLSPGLNFELIHLLLEYYHKLGKVNRIELPMLVTDATNILSRVNYLDRVHVPTSNERNILALSTQFIEENTNNRLSVESVGDHVNMGYGIRIS